MAYHPIHYIKDCIPKDVFAEMQKLAFGFEYERHPSSPHLNGHQHYYGELLEWASHTMSRDCRVRVKKYKGLAIQKFSVGEGMDSHQDFADYYVDPTDFAPTMAMVYYLNDDYEGGEICFSQEKHQNPVHQTPREELLEMASSIFKPEANSCVMFDSRIWHWVVPVISGSRYSYTVFYDTEDLDNA